MHLLSTPMLAAKMVCSRNDPTPLLHCCCCVLLLVQSELDNVDEHRAESDGCSSVVFLDPLY